MKSIFEQDRVLQAYQAVEMAKLKLQMALVDREDWERRGPGVPGGKAWEEDGIVWLALPDAPPILKGASYQLQREVRERWRDWVTYALDQAGIKRRFEHAVVVIKIYSKVIHDWDVDNRAVKAMINGLRLYGLMKDDSWKHMSYLVTGQEDDGSPGTDVAVVERGDWENFIRAVEAPRQAKLDPENWAKNRPKGIEKPGQFDMPSDDAIWPWDDNAVLPVFVPANPCGSKDF